MRGSCALWQDNERAESECSTASALACFDGEVESMKISQVNRLLDFRTALPVIAVLLCTSVSGIAQDRNPGAQTYEQNCGVCHGDDGKGGGKASDIATTQSVISLSDADLFKIVRDGTAGGMPPFAKLGDPIITAVVGYLRTMQGVASGGTALA